MIQTINNICTEYGFSGQVLLAKGGMILYHRAYGLADLDKETTLTAASRLRLASISKQITAGAILRLVQEEKLSLDDTLTRFFPDVPAVADVTIHHLLSNTSGLADFPIEGDYSSYFASGDYRTFIENVILSQPLKFTPGEKFEYNGSSYVILTHIIEDISGLSFPEYLNQTIFEPLEMFDSGFLMPGADIDNLACAYNPSDDGLTVAPEIDMRIAGGGGALYGNAMDLFRWNTALHQKSFLSDELYQNMTTPQVALTEDTKYGYGFFLQESGDDILCYHPGGGPGVRTINVVYLKSGYQLVLLSNVNDKDVFHAVQNTLLHLIQEKL